MNIGNSKGTFYVSIQQVSNSGLTYTLYASVINYPTVVRGIVEGTYKVTMSLIYFFPFTATLKSCLNVLISLIRDVLLAFIVTFPSRVA